jgi:hypothetical protein
MQPLLSLRDALSVLESYAIRGESESLGLIPRAADDITKAALLEVASQFNLVARTARTFINADPADEPSIMGAPDVVQH